MHHAHVSQIQFIPFFMLAFLLTLERKSLPLLLAAIGLFALNALSCWYYLFYVAYFIAFHTVYVAIRDRALPRGWQLATPMACAAGVVAILSPLPLPMVQAALAGAPVYVSGSDIYVADVLAYLAFPPYHLLGRWSEPLYARIVGADSNEWEATVYLGLVNVMVLAWLAITGRGSERKLLIYVLAGMGVFCIFASGDSLHVLHYRVLRMPDFVLAHLPFFRNVRTPSRAIVFTYLFMAIGIGCAAARALRARQPHLGRLGMTSVAVLIVLDFFPARPLPVTPLVCSPGLEAIRNDPETGFGVLDLPSGKPADYNAGNVYMFQQTCHGRPIAQGNTSRDTVVSLRDRIETRDLQAQQRQLTNAGVKYIVLNRRPMGIPLSWHPEEGAMEAYMSFYPIVYDGPDLTVLRVY